MTALSDSASPISAMRCGRRHGRSRIPSRIPLHKSHRRCVRRPIGPQRRWYCAGCVAVPRRVSSIAWASRRKSGAVGQTGQLVMMGSVGDLPHSGTICRDVLEHHDAVDHFTIGAAHRRCRQLDVIAPPSRLSMKMQCERSWPKHRATGLGAGSPIVSSMMRSTSA
jgi:hypothetical protein